jgi:hypothetical protein
MCSIKSVKVIGDAWESLLIACILKKNIQGIDVIVVNQFVSRHEALWIEQGLNTLLHALGVNIKFLMQLCDGTFHLAHHMSNSQSIKNFFWSANEYGVTNEVIEFHQIFERFADEGMLYDDFCLEAQLAKYSKIQPSLYLSQANCTGIHLDSKRFTHLLELYAAHLKIKVIRSDDTKKMINADLIINTSQPRGGFKSPDGSCEDWNKWFSHRYAIYWFIKSKLDTAPASKLNVNDSGLIKSIPLRMGIFNKYLIKQKNAKNLYPIANNVEHHEEYLDFGALSTPWNLTCLSMGGAASNPNDMLVSAVDRIICETEFLLRLWPALPIQESVINEYNRLVGLFYRSVRDFHLLAQWLLLENGNLAEMKRLPESLIQEINVFVASAKLPHRDDRFPRIHQWHSLLMGLKSWPIYQPNICLDNSNDDISKFLHKMACSIKSITQSAPSQVDILKPHTTI